MRPKNEETKYRVYEFINKHTSNRQIDELALLFNCQQGVSALFCFHIKTFE